MKYAPVTIPTLCRYEHFRKCLDSLEECVGSEHTDVYIALDYPAKESHWGGYSKIDMYLRKKQEKNRFKTLTVVRRTENMGIRRNNLVLDIFKKYDRVIYSEDDNVFSPNFLLFINKGLMLCEKDKKLISVCGYSYPFEYRFDGNYYYHNSHFCAWGYGILKERSLSLNRDLNNGFFKDTFSLKNYFKIRKKGYDLLFSYVNAVFHDLVHDYSYRKTDRVVTAYMILKEFKVITPSVTKVRNEGWDISGNSFEGGKQTRLMLELSKRHMNQEIDNSLFFDFTGNPLTYFEYNNKITDMSNEWPMSYGEYLIKVFSMVIHGLFKKIGIRKKRL